MSNDLQMQNDALVERLREAEETLDAIRNGEVDAVVVAGGDGIPQVYTLETADQTYRVLVEEMQEGAVTLTSDGTILYCNPRMASLLGEKPALIVGRSLERFIPLKEYQAFQQLASTGGKGEFLIVAANGNEVPAHFSFAPLRRGEGGVETFCCVVTDLTKQYQTQLALSSANEMLKAEMSERARTEILLRQSQKMEVVGQLTGGVAHDFNNLLMAISSGLDMLDRQTDPARRQRIKDGMRQSVDRGAGLTRQLLTFSRTQALAPEPVDLRQQISGMRELLDRSLRGDIQVVTDFGDDVWPVFVDANEFEMVILNLSVNARDAMPQGGLITIGGQNIPDWNEGIFAGDFVAVFVKDTGTGMSPDVLAHAFEPFFTTKDIGKGSGLGLAQAYGFAEASGGTVKISSREGEGTTISLLLPRSASVAKQTLPPVSDGPDAIRIMASARGHILLVEDDKAVAEFTTEMLADLGFEVTWVAGGQAALGAIADGRHIDLVFSDIMMPGGMNGIELARQLKKRCPDLPVVLASGHSTAFEAEAEQLKIRLLAKPYRMDDLEDIMVQTLS